MERFTKLLVLAWTASALAVQIDWMSSGWRDLPLLSGILFAAAFILSAVSRRGMAVVLGLTYLFPAAISVYTGRYVAQFAVLWMAGLLGAMLPAALRTPWLIPIRWRGPLVCWALSVVVGASIVTVREFDFTTALLHVSNVSNSVRGGWPSFTVSWVLHVALVTLLGIIFFDWMCGLSADDFRRSVVVPLAISFVGSSAVAAYQLFGETTFLNSTTYGVRGRAAGMLMDANVFGTVAALWIGAMLLFVQHASGRRRAAAAAGVVLACVGVFASGSRTGLAAAIIVTMFSGVALLAKRWNPQSRWTWAGIVGGAAVAAGAVVLLASIAPGTMGPLRRVRALLPAASIQSVRSFGQLMWTRNGYGSIATDMIREYPVVGVGVGSFHIMSSDFARRSGRGGIAPDNAQNWYRHQIAEFGVLGSLGWIAWTWAFMVYVLRQRPSDRVAAWVPRGMLVAFAAISLVGMPGQDVIACATFWAAACAYMFLVDTPRQWQRLPTVAWIAIAAVVIAFGVGTARVSATQLRVPVRAARVGWPYSYGLYAPVPDGSGGQQRWTAGHAVSVVDASTRWMAITVSVNHLALRTTPQEAAPVVPTRPVTIRVWCDGQIVFDTEVVDTGAMTKFVWIPQDHPRVLLEMRTSRVFRPKDLGLDDNRELGMLLDWRFVSEAPQGASVVRLEPGPAWAQLPR